jgi:alpha-1,3-fucosyltransferase
MGQEPFVRAGCRVTNCVTTDDRSFLNESDALLFHPINYDPVNDVPPHRNPRQRYVFMFYEAEASNRIYPVFQNSTTQEGFFNWTMTYRRDSDVYSPEPYGILRRKNTSSMNMNTLPVKLTPGTLPPDPAMFLESIMNSSTSKTKQDSLVSNKTKKIAWFVSKCWTQSRRENFFRQLFDFYPSIDVYGECGSKGLDCLPWKSLKCDKIIADYKFYIAAENSFCPDYVTEKFYRALQVGAVPIVYGGADYSAYSPPYSFIHAGDFQSPKALADYLILLDENPNLYARYFEWKKDWIVDRQPFDGWCALCEKLNDPEASQASKSYKDIGIWWFDVAPCLLRTSIKNQSLHK